MKTVSTVLLILAASVAPAFAAAPAWDSSGNSQLHRHILFSSGHLRNRCRWQHQPRDLSATATSRSAPPPEHTCFSGLGQADSSGQGASVTTTGTYSVSASGYGFLSDPSLYQAQNIYFLVSKRCSYRQFDRERLQRYVRCGPRHCQCDLVGHLYNLRLLPWRHRGDNDRRELPDHP